MWDKARAHHAETTRDLRRTYEAVVAKIRAANEVGLNTDICLSERWGDPETQKMKISGKSGNFCFF